MASIPNKWAIPILGAAMQYIEDFLWDTGDVKLSVRIGDHGRWVFCDGRSAAQWPELEQMLAQAGSPFGVSSGHSLLPPPEARSLCKAGTGGGLQTRALGATFGTEPTNMPAHSHPIGSSNFDRPAINVAGAEGNLGTGSAVAVLNNTAPAGSGSATDGNQPPSLAFNLFMHT